MGKIGRGRPKSSRQMLPERVTFVGVDLNRSVNGRLEGRNVRYPTGWSASGPPPHSTVLAARFPSVDSSAACRLQPLPHSGPTRRTPCEICGPSRRGGRRTGHRNRAIGHVLRYFDMLEDHPMAAVDVYVQQCAISVRCVDLALMGTGRWRPAWQMPPPSIWRSDFPPPTRRLNGERTS